MFGPGSTVMLAKHVPRGTQFLSANARQATTPEITGTNFTFPDNHNDGDSLASFQKAGSV